MIGVLHHLLDNIILIFTLPDFDPLVFVSIVLLDTGCIGTVFVYIDQAGFPIGADRFVEKSAGGLRITLSYQEKIDGIAFNVKRSPYATYVDKFVLFIRGERGLSSVTIATRQLQITNFLGAVWHSGNSLNAISIQDVDTYLAR